MKSKGFIQVNISTIIFINPYYKNLKFYSPHGEAIFFGWA